MTTEETTAPTKGSTFTEPSPEVKRRNRITGLIILGLILGMIAVSIFVRVNGS